MSLEQLECPNCGSDTLTSNPDGTLTCSFCGDRYAAPGGVLCPSCGQVNDEEANYCQECGYDLIRECPACGAGSPHDATHCQICGRPLSALEEIVERLQEKTAGRLERQMRESVDIKVQEEADSQRRLEEMWLQEHERQQAIATAKAEQQRQEQLLVRSVFILVILVILVILGVILISVSSSGGESAPSGLPILLTAYA